MRYLRLIKGREQYFFRYAAGEESQILDAICESAKSGQITWFDAAVLADRLGNALRDEIAEMLAQ